MTGTRRILIGALGAAILVLLWIVVAGRGGAAEVSTVRPDPASAFTVDHVVDGDTIRATPADAPAREIAGVDESVRVRLIGIDTPEMRPEPECGADAATERLQKLLPEGATVWAAPDRDTHDRYERLLLYLWTEDGTFVNETLIVDGHASALEVAPNDTYAERFAAAEETARRDGAGRWGACG